MRKISLLRTALTLALVIAASASVQAKPPIDDNWMESGVASWYGPGFAGNPTASGEIYDPNHLTAAHKTLPLGTLVRVYNVDNDREMIVRINDRGPFIDGRIIDLSRAAAEVLGFKDVGLAQVEVTVVRAPRTRKASQALMEAVGQAATAGLHAILPAAASPERVPSEVEHTAPAAVSTPETTPPFEPDWDPPSWNTQHDEEGYFIQVGAFRHSMNAEDLIRRIEGLGLAHRLRETGNMVRVLVGPFGARSDAVNAQRNLELHGIDGFLRTSER